jgi:hypothetical protein
MVFRTASLLRAKVTSPASLMIMSGRDARGPYEHRHYLSPDQFYSAGMGLASGGTDGN